MKYKHLFIVFIVVFILLLYNIFCYLFVNNLINDGTKSVINTYLKSSCSDCRFEYEFLKATSNEDSSMNVFVKVDSKLLEKYYRFIFVKNNNRYQLINVNNDVPAYVK